MESRVNKNDREVLKYRIERNSDSPTGFFRLAEQLLPDEMIVLADGRPMSRIDLLAEAVAVDRYFGPAWRLLALDLDHRRRSGKPSCVRLRSGQLMTLSEVASQAVTLSPDEEVEALLKDL